MFSVKLIVSYDGTYYLGWQKTHTGKSIQEELEKVLSQILQEKIDLEAASRTDAGVHAQGQVVHFVSQKETIDLKRLHFSLTRLLPKDISVLYIEEVPLHFHPTLEAKAKEYHYFLCNSPVQAPFHRHFSWHYPYSLCLERMRQAAIHLLGTHDFSAFCNERSLWTRPAQCNILHLEIQPIEDRRFQFILIGDHFLYKMARNIVGTLVYAGCNKLSPEEIPEILTSKDRKRAGITAPAYGLSLRKVFYEPFVGCSSGKNR